MLLSLCALLLLSELLSLVVVEELFLEVSAGFLELPGTAVDDLDRLSVT